MDQITWKEFKEIIDEQLKEKGISEDTEIWYIDISFPRKEDIGAGYEKNLGIYI